MNIGNRIIQNIIRADRELVEGFRGIPSSNINDMMNRLYCRREYMRPFNRRPLLGTAFTVKAPDGDNVMLHCALDLAQPGDVIVVDGGGCVTRSLCGEIMFNYAKVCGIEGFLVDGAIRDNDSLLDMDFSVYAKGVTPQGPYKNGLGEINVPVSCGGQVVFPGDIIAGDADGICVIRKEVAAEVLKKAQKKLAQETEILKDYHQGNLDSSSHKKTYFTILERTDTSWE